MAIIKNESVPINDPLNDLLKRAKQTQKSWELKIWVLESKL